MEGFAAAIDRHGSLCVWTLKKDGALLLHVKPETSSGQFRAVAFLTPTRVAAAGIHSSASYLKQEPSPIRVWDVVTREIVLDIPLSGRPDLLSPVAALLPLPTPAGSFASVHTCGRIRIWDAASGTAFAALRWWDAELSAGETLGEMPPPRPST